jgi:hypothetical protein
VCNDTDLECDPHLPVGCDSQAMRLGLGAELDLVDD